MTAPKSNALRRFFTLRRKAYGVLIAIALTLAATERSAERYGDNLQIALPLIAWGCAGLNGQGLEYFGRYAVHFIGLRSTKMALGDAPINQRPSGGGHGFPSGHTSTAVFGASSIVTDCVTKNAFVQGVTLMAAGFVGTSRVETGWHDIWQVFAGALWGWLCARAFRAQGWPRQMAGRVLRQIWRPIKTLARSVFRGARARISPPKDGPTQ